MLIKIALGTLFIILIPVGWYFWFQAMKNFKDPEKKKSNFYYFFQGIIFDKNLLNENGQRLYRIFNIVVLVAMIIFFVFGLIMLDK